MIYDLKILRETMTQGIKTLTFDQSKPTIMLYQFDALLAIAERLEALVEAEVKRNELNAELLVLQQAMVVKKAEVKEDPVYIEAINNLADSLKGNHKTLDELRGEK